KKKNSPNSNNSCNIKIKTKPTKLYDLSSNKLNKLTGLIPKSCIQSFPSYIIQPLNEKKRNKYSKINSIEENNTKKYSTNEEYINIITDDIEEENITYSNDESIKYGGILSVQ